MSHRALLTLALAPSLLLTLAACSGSAASKSQPGQPPDVNVDRANVPRDPASSIDPTAVSGAVAANNAFAFDLYGHVLAAQSAPGNLSRRPSARRSRSR